VIALLFSAILTGQLSHASQELYPCFKYGFEEDVIFAKGTPNGVGAKKEGDSSIPGMSFCYLANSGPKPLIVHVQYIIQPGRQKLRRCLKSFGV
jgi:hypothetical protein